MDPTNYYGQLAPADLGAALLGGVQQGEQAMALQAAQQRAAQQQALKTQALQQALLHPSAANYGALMTLDPEHHDALKSAWEAQDKDTQKTTLQDLSAARGYLYAGRAEDAKRIIQRQVDAYEKAGKPVEEAKQLLQTIDDAGPEVTGRVVDYMLAGIMGPEKWESTFKTIGEDARAEAKLPAEIAKTVADASLASASAGKTVAEAGEVAPNAASQRAVEAAQVQNYQSAITDRAARLDLDRDTLETNTSLELEKLRNKGVELSPGSETAMTNAVVGAESARQLATRANTLADKIATAPVGLGGVFASIKEAGAGTFGKQDPVSALRKEYQTLITSQAVSNLPPGPASDKDIKLAMSGFPPNTANAATMAGFLRGMAKLQAIKANREQGRADWISENGNIGRAKRDITVNGVRVPAGSTFADFSASASAIERREAAGEKSYMRFGSGSR